MSLRADSERLLRAVLGGGAEAVDAELAGAYPAQPEALRPAAQAALDRSDWDALALIASHLAQQPRGAAPRSLSAVSSGRCAAGIGAQLDALGAQYPCVVQKCPSCAHGAFMGHVQFTVRASDEADREFALAIAPRLGGGEGDRVRVGKVVAAGRTVPLAGKQVQLYSAIFESAEEEDSPAYF